MGAIVKPAPMGAIVKASTKAGNHLQLINRPIEQFAPALSLAKRYRAEWERLGETIGCKPYTGRVHPHFLAAMPKMAAARNMLWQVEGEREKIDRATALAMLHVLFASIGKRKGDEDSAILLAAAADMFNPVNHHLCDVTGVKPLNRHPLILALAVKRIVSTAKWTSCAELAEAMEYVTHFIRISTWALEFMVDAIEDADEIVFERDRAAWEETHAKVPVAVNRWLLEDFWNHDGPFVDDDVERPGSPRWEALKALTEAKGAADSKPPLPPPAPSCSSSDGGESSPSVGEFSPLRFEAATAPPEPLREAACTARPVKRTRKPKAEAVP